MDNLFEDDILKFLFLIEFESIHLEHGCFYPKVKINIINDLEIWKELNSLTK